MDCSVHHPHTGLGEYKKNALQEAYKSKVNSHGQACEYQDYYFLPAIGFTCGRQHEDLVRHCLPVKCM